MNNNFSLENNFENWEEITLKPELLKEHFSSQENFYCKLCDNLIVKITQCAKCETLFCKKCISKKLESNENCPICLETFEDGNVPKITKNILYAFNIKCPFNCETEGISYSSLFSHLKECKMQGKVYSCKFCYEKILISQSDNLFQKTFYEHKNNCPEKKADCEFCKQSLLKKDLKLHLSSCEERNIKCEHCQFVYPYKMTHDENHCAEIKILRKNLEIYKKKNGI